MEISEATLRRYGTVDRRRRGKIGQASIESGGGKIETSAGEILLRVDDRREWAREYSDIPIVTTPEGTVLTLGQIASVREGLRGGRINSRQFNGKRSMGHRRVSRRRRDPHRRFRCGEGGLEEIEPRAAAGRGNRHPQSTTRTPTASASRCC